MIATNRANPKTTKRFILMNLQSKKTNRKAESNSARSQADSRPPYTVRSFPPVLFIPPQSAGHHRSCGNVGRMRKHYHVGKLRHQGNIRHPPVNGGVK